jgi:hypothetical protein
LTDGQFEPLRSELSGMGVTLNTIARGEHVPGIKRHIRMLKERVRSVYNTLPFKKIPDRMLIELIYYCTFWLNSFPNTDGISRSLSPQTVVTGYNINYHKHCKLEFGEYVQTHKEHNKTMISRTVRVIALRPTGNYQGSYIFFNLNTGRTMSRNRWTMIPMPNKIIEKVETMVSSENDIWLNEDLIEDIEDMASNEDTVTNVEDIRIIQLGSSDKFSKAVEPVDDKSEIPHLDIPMNDYVEDGNMLENMETIENDEKMNETEIMVENHEPTETEDYENKQSLIFNENENTDFERKMESRYGPRTNNYDLRPRRLRDYSHLHATVDHLTLTQYSLKRGLKIFGNEGILAVKKELQQLHERDVLSPVDANKLGN